ncbi:hypothetical protein [Rhizobium mongolense]|uniref:Uncharacterized protein n=1 Tax=Rhizobium mongolense TaxID=57676 RepID=A0A7W6WC20_9HYPH|nr:hypothetical protein [Rhizobium mongolense]MBB4272345.1 hypothetical protein [Rhizobium mongolense]
MPNTIPAAGEAMPKITRRNALGLMAAVTIPPTVVAAAPIANATVADPLIEAINAYRAGIADFNQNAPEDDEGANAYGEISWLPPFKALENWTAPATTRDGAMAALRLAVDEDEVGDSPLVGTMMRAALAYLEQEGRL